MTENFQELQIRYEEKSLKAAEFAKTAAEKTHTVFMAQRKSQEAVDAISSGNKATMWNTLQKYLRSYSDFINRTARITGLRLYRVDKDFYDNVTSDDIKKQLHMVIGFVYAYEAVTSAAKATFKNCLKKLLKNSGLFTDAELVLL